MSRGKVAVAYLAWTALIVALNLVAWRLQAFPDWMRPHPGGGKLWIVLVGVVAWSLTMLGVLGIQLISYLLRRKRRRPGLARASTAG